MKNQFITAPLAPDTKGAGFYLTDLHLKNLLSFLTLVGLTKVPYLLDCSFCSTFLTNKLKWLKNLNLPAKRAKQRLLHLFQSVWELKQPSSRAPFSRVQLGVASQQPFLYSLNWKPLTKRMFETGWNLVFGFDARYFLATISFCFIVSLRTKSGKEYFIASIETNLPALCSPAQHMAWQTFDAFLSKTIIETKNVTPSGPSLEPLLKTTSPPPKTNRGQTSNPSSPPVKQASGSLPSCSEVTTEPCFLKNSALSLNLFSDVLWVENYFPPAWSARKFVFIVNTTTGSEAALPALQGGAKQGTIQPFDIGGEQRHIFVDDFMGFVPEQASEKTSLRINKNKQGLVRSLPSVRSTEGEEGWLWRSNCNAFFSDPGDKQKQVQTHHRRVGRTSEATAANFSQDPDWWDDLDEFSTKLSQTFGTKATLPPTPAKQSPRLLRDRLDRFVFGVEGGSEQVKSLLRRAPEGNGWLEQNRADLDHNTKNETIKFVASNFHYPNNWQATQPSEGTGVASLEGTKTYYYVGVVPPLGSERSTGCFATNPGALPPSFPEEGAGVANKQASIKNKQQAFKENQQPCSEATPPVRVAKQLSEVRAGGNPPNDQVRGRAHVRVLRTEGGVGNSLVSRLNFYKKTEQLREKIIKCVIEQPQKQTGSCFATAGYSSKGAGGNPPSPRVQLGETQTAGVEIKKQSPQINSEETRKASAENSVIELKNNQALPSFSWGGLFPPEGQTEQIVVSPLVKNELPLQSREANNHFISPRKASPEGKGIEALMARKMSGYKYPDMGINQIKNWKLFTLHQIRNQQPQKQTGTTGCSEATAGSCFATAGGSPVIQSKAPSQKNQRALWLTKSPFGQAKQEARTVPGFETPCFAPELYTGGFAPSGHQWEGESCFSGGKKERILLKIKLPSNSHALISQTIPLVPAPKLKFKKQVVAGAPFGGTLSPSSGGENQQLKKGIKLTLSSDLAGEETDIDLNNTPQVQEWTHWFISPYNPFTATKQRFEGKNKINYNQKNATPVYLVPTKASLASPPSGVPSEARVASLQPPLRGQELHPLSQEQAPRPSEGREQALDFWKKTKLALSPPALPFQLEVTAPQKLESNSLQPQKQTGSCFATAGYSSKGAGGSPPSHFVGWGPEGATFLGAKNINKKQNRPAFEIQKFVDSLATIPLEKQINTTQQTVKNLNTRLKNTWFDKKKHVSDRLRNKTTIHFFKPNKLFLIPSSETISLDRALSSTQELIFVNKIQSRFSQIVTRQARLENIDNNLLKNLNKSWTIEDLKILFPRHNFEQLPKRDFDQFFRKNFPKLDLRIPQETTIELPRTFIDYESLYEFFSSKYPTPAKQSPRLLRDRLDRFVFGVEGGSEVSFPTKSHVSPQKQTSGSQATAEGSRRLPSNDSILPKISYQFLPSSQGLLQDSQIQLQSVSGLPRTSLKPFYNFEKSVKRSPEKQTHRSLLKQPRVVAKQPHGAQKTKYRVFEPWQTDLVSFVLGFSKLVIGLALKQQLQVVFKNYNEEIIDLVKTFDPLLARTLLEEQAEKKAVGRSYKKVKKRLKDIAGIDPLFPQLLELILFLRNSGRQSTRMAPAPKGILLVGPPGTGKTILVQALAGEAEVPILAHSGSEFQQISIQDDDTTEQVKDMFKRAQRFAPCILFIDEIDSLGQTRGMFFTNAPSCLGENPIDTLIGIGEKTLCFDSPQSREQDITSLPALPTARDTLTFLPASNSFAEKQNQPEETDFFGLDREGIEINVFESRTKALQKFNKRLQETVNSEKSKTTKIKTLVEFLVQMDGFSAGSRKGVLVIGATNRPGKLDPAFIRPGRFSKIITLELPGKKKRIEILKLYSRNLGIDKTFCSAWDYVINRTAGFSAADLAAVMNQSAIQAILNQSIHSVKSFEKGIDLLTTDSIETPFNSTKKYKDPFVLARQAYYQAGKIVIHTAIPDHPPVVVMSLWPRPSNARQKSQKPFFMTSPANANQGGAEAASSLFPYYYRRKHLESLMIGFYAGKAAELLLLFSHPSRARVVGVASPQLGQPCFGDKTVLWQSDSGTKDLSAASCLAVFMVERAYFFSKKIATRKTHLIVTQQNKHELKHDLLITGYGFLTDELENEILTRLPTLPYYQNRYLGARWQIQILRHFEILNLIYDDWYRIYLPDSYQNKRNLEWVPPDKYFHGNNNSKNLVNTQSGVVAKQLQLEGNLKKERECKIFSNKWPEGGNGEKLGLTWNTIYSLNRDYFYHSLCLASFNKAFLILDRNREIVDYFASYLIRHGIVRQNEIETIFSQFLPSFSRGRSSPF